MLLGGNETTRKIDSFAINELKIPSIVLMENAAISFVKHIDENADWYKKKVEYVLDEIAKTDAIIEINTGGMSRGWTQTPYPSIPILKRILAKNIPITISSDAHETKNIDFYFEESLEIARKVGFKSVKILDGGEFKDFEI